MKNLASVLSILLFFTTLQGQDVQFQLKVFLQGPYQSSGTMNAGLNTGGYIPLTQPYNGGIWNYDGTEALTLVPAGMVDWVLVDLRVAPDTAVARQAAILYSDGTVRDVHGNTSLAFNVPAGHYYVAIMHRSHLSAMTAAKLAFPASSALDFSDTTALAVYGRCLIGMSGGVMGMISGDLNDDRMLKYSGSGNDRSLILTRILSIVGGSAINAITSGYFREDLRMDGVVKYSGSGNDQSLIIQNIVNLMGTSAINAVFHGPVPHAVLDPGALQTFKSCGDVLLDMRDYQPYPTVLIGDQCWMAKNLNIGEMMMDHTAGNHTHSSDNGIIEKYCYNNDSSYCEIYGGLYDWDEMMNYMATDSQGICPDGWHVPSADEWTIMGNTLGGYVVAGGPLKEAGNTHWNAPNVGATNSSGFTALPGSHRLPTGGFSQYINQLGYFWTSTDLAGIYAYYRVLENIITTLGSYNGQKTYGFSVRCVQDFIPCTPQPDQANAGPDMLNLPDVFVTLQGNHPVNGTGEWNIISGTGGNLANNNAHNTQFSGHPGEIYTLTWSISTVCGSTTDTVLIGFACNPQYLMPYAGPDTSICIDDCAFLTASGGVSYIWNTQETTVSIQVCPTNTTTYTVTVTDVYGCTASANVVVTVHPLPAANAGPDVEVCSGECAQLQASGGVSYLWSTQETTADIMVCPMVTSLFSVTVTDMYGCVAMDDVSVTVNPIPQANAGPDVSVCQDDCAQLQASGGVAYLWSTQETTAGIEVCPASTTPYQVTVTDMNGCSATDEVLVTVNPLPNVVAGPDTSICPGDCVQLTATGGLSYLWSTQESVASITVCPGQTTDYAVTVTDVNGCESTAEVWVVLLDLPFTYAGPDTLNIPATSILLQGNQPGEGTGLWTILSGTGGSFADSSLYNTLFSGIADSLYTLVWTITNSCGSASDTVTIGFSPVPMIPCEGLIVDDRDDQTYPILQIGSQCWMGRNLNIGTLITSSFMGGTVFTNASDNGIIEKYCYNNIIANCEMFGGLYDWNEMMDYVLTPATRGICPEGWHVPTDAEYKIMEGNVDSQYGVGDVEWNYFGWRGQDVGGKLKHAGTDYWLAPNVGATNSTGFTALPAGFRGGIGFFGNMGSNTYFWTSSTFGEQNAYYRWLGYTQPGMWRDIDRNRAYGFSVRCLRDMDCDDIPDQADAGPDTLNIPDVYIQLQANQPQNGIGVWTIASGSGGQFLDPNAHNAVFIGQSGETYQLVWNIATGCLGYSDTVNIGFAMVNVPKCDSVLIDTRDSTEYPVVQIGNQCWMAKNLNVGTFTPSVFVHLHDVHSDVSDNGIIEKYCYANIESNCDIWGGMYDWDEMMNYVNVEGTQGICPPDTGWQIPSDTQWMVMEGNVDSYYGVGDPEWDQETGRGTDIGGRLKETGFAHWDSPNTGATNGSGFSALPAGWRYFAGNFDNLNEWAFFWTSTQYPTVQPYAYARSISHEHATVTRYGMYKPFGYSVRCVKELPPCTPAVDQANAGPDQHEVSGNSVQLEAVTPTVGYGMWSIQSGYGGTLVSPAANNSIFNGLPGEEYVLTWTVTNICGTTTDDVWIGFADTSNFSCGDSLLDIRDGKMYPTVQIGIHCWMARNLNVGDYVLSIYTGADHSELTNNSIIEKFCLNNVPALCDVYGGLYSWDEMMAYSTVDGSAGICPPLGGWRLPSDEDWKILEGSVDTYYGVGDPEWDNDNYYRGWDAAEMLMDGTPANWSTTYTYLAGTNSSGFAVIPGENRGFDGGVNQDEKLDAYFWTSTQSGWNMAWSRMFSGDNSGVYRVANQEMNNGYSVRCLKDMPQSCAPQPDQAQAGPDSSDIQGSTFAMQANQPGAGAGQWTILSGPAGSFADPSVHNTTFTGVPGQTYVLEWRITTVCGSTADTIIISFAAPVIQTCGVLVDNRDGQQYPTVVIGTKCWMAKNLNVGTMVNSVQGPTWPGVTNNGIIEKYCYANNSSNCDVYGGLYDWNEMMGYQNTPGTQGICPDLWYIPTDADWTALVNLLGGATTAGGKMKEMGLDHWDSPNEEATNASGFTALGAGWRTYNGYFQYLKAVTQYWSSSSASSNYAWGRTLGTYSGEIDRYDSFKSMGSSVRCVKDIP